MTIIVKQMPITLLYGMKLVHVKCYMWYNNECYLVNDYNA